MQEELRTHNVVALLEQQPAEDFESGRSLTLRRGQIGTVVVVYPDGACEVEFADPQGRTFALATLKAKQLMLLHDAPDYAAR